MFVQRDIEQMTETGAAAKRDLLTTWEQAAQTDRRGTDSTDLLHLEWETQGFEQQK